MERNAFNSEINSYSKKWNNCGFFSKKNRSVNKIVLFIIVLSSSFMMDAQFAAIAAPDIPSLPAVPVFDPGRVKERIEQEEVPPPPVTPQKILQPKPESLSTSQVSEAEKIKFKLAGITIIGATIYSQEELSQYYKSYLGKEVSLVDLQNITANITARYRKDGYVLSRAILPAQQIVTGKVQIQIIEGYIAEVYLEGEVSKVKSRIEQYGKKIKQMRPLQIKKLERYVLSLNDIPGLVVKSILSPATSGIGGADLTFIIEQQRISGEVYFDNRGTRFMGPEQVVATIGASDAFFAADNLSLQTIDTPVHSELRYLQLNYAYPIGTSGLHVKLNGSVTETNPDFTLKDLDLVGRAKNWGILFEYPLWRSRNKNCWLYAQFDWLDTYTRFNIFPFFQDHIRSARFGASYDFVDQKRGSSIIDLTLSKGLKIFGASPPNPLTPLSRQNGRSDYTKLNFNLSRYQSLNDRLLLFGSVTGQHSFNQPLLSAEEFSFGGVQFGRAYDSSEIAGDSGIAAKLEMRYNTYPNLKLLQQIQYYGYYEIGAIWNIANEALFQVDKDSGSDVGGGIRITFNRHIHGNIEIAKPLTRKVDTQVAAGQDGNTLRLYFGLGARL